MREGGIQKASLTNSGWRALWRRAASLSLTLTSLGPLARAPPLSNLRSVWARPATGSGWPRGVRRVAALRQ
eukprot:4162639-Prymnesium_polylepis.1